MKKYNDVKYFDFANSQLAHKSYTLTNNCINIIYGI